MEKVMTSKFFQRCGAMALGLLVTQPIMANGHRFFFDILFSFAMIMAVSTIYLLLNLSRTDLRESIKRTMDIYIGTTIGMIVAIVFFSAGYYGRS